MSRGASDIVVRVTDWADEPGASLRARQLEEILKDIEGEDEEGTVPSAEDIIAVIILEIDGSAVACASLRECGSSVPTDERCAEVKRMFVVPEQRGSALGTTTRLMEEVEEEARSRGYRELKLATGTRMDRARRFYERQGFVQTSLFPPYLTTTSTICYSKRLP